MIVRLLVALLMLLAFTVPAKNAGTIFGLPLSIQVDANGVPLSGAKLFLFAANSSSPRDTFADFGLSEGQKLSHPIVADAAGRLPQFWVADGAYRVRLTTAAGVEVFDHTSVTAIGPSAGGAGGEGGGVDETAIFATGDFLWQPIAGTRTGWVRANGRTIGSAASGATERANADTGPLYEWLWNNFSNADAPVTGGRGATASADFTADKAIGVIDMRGFLTLGSDTMGSTAAGRVVGADDPAETAGASTHTNTIGEMVAHTHTGPSHTHTGPSHTHTFSATTSSNGLHNHGTNAHTGNINMTSGGTTVSDTNNANINDDGVHTHTVSGTTGAEGTGATGASGTGDTGLTGSTTAFNIMNPYRVGTIYLKL